MPGGNFGSEVAGSQIGYNILYEATTVSALAARYSMDGADIAQKLMNDRKILLDARNKRVRPLVDDKILMDWNGFMIGALAKAAIIFNKPEWRSMAEKAAFNLQKLLVDPKGNWRRRFRAGSSSIPALAGDYAALLWGIMELYKAAKQSEAGEKQLNDWLKYAQNLADLLINNFRDESTGGLFLSLSNDDDNFIFFRRIAAEDNALPSVNALAALALSELGLELGAERDGKKYADIARKILACFARFASANPLENLSLITAAELWRPVKAKPKPVEKVNKVNKSDEDLKTENLEAENSEEAEAKSDRASRRAARAARSERAERASSSRSERGARAERSERRARPERRRR